VQLADILVAILLELLFAAWAPVNENSVSLIFFVSCESYAVRTMNSCKSCGLHVGSKDKHVTCSACSERFHFPDCCGLEENFDRRRKWTCSACLGGSNLGGQNSDSDKASSANVSAPVKFPATATVQAVTLEQVLASVQELRNFTSEKYESLQNEVRQIAGLIQRSNDHEQRINSLEEAMNQLSDAEVVSRLEHVEEKMRDMRSENEQIGKENKALRAELNWTKKRCERQEEEIVNLQQYSRKTGIVITGIPAIQGENVRVVIKSLMECLNVGDALLLDCHRLKKDDPTSNIVIKFGSYYDATRFYDAARAKMKTKQFKVLMMLPDVHFVSAVQDENMGCFRQLCPALNALRFAAKSFAKAAGFKYCWADNGSVYIRKDDDTERIVIKNMDAVAKFRASHGLPLMDSAKSL
jgi:hypothetical protein